MPFITTNNGRKEYKLIVCEVIEKHEITHEPMLLRVIQPTEVVSVVPVDGVFKEFVTLFGDAKVFEMASKK